MRFMYRPGNEPFDGKFYQYPGAVEKVITLVAIRQPIDDADFFPLDFDRLGDLVAGRIVDVDTKQLNTNKTCSYNIRSE